MVVVAVVLVVMVVALHEYSVGINDETLRVAGNNNFIFYHSTALSLRCHFGECVLGITSAAHLLKQKNSERENSNKHQAIATRAKMNSKQRKKHNGTGDKTTDEKNTK